MNRRLGKFVISREFIDRWPSNVLRIMGRCIILRAEYRLSEDCIFYEAMSYDFQEIPVGKVPPTYNWIFDDEWLYAEIV